MIDFEHKNVFAPNSHLFIGKLRHTYLYTNTVYMYLFLIFRGLKKCEILHYVQRNVSNKEKTQVNAKFFLGSSSVTDKSLNQLKDKNLIFLFKSTNLLDFEKFY